MPLGNDYAGQMCSIARSLEVVGERWTLLIVRDAFYGVRRFTDFHAHLGIPKAVLTERLRLLVEEGVLKRVTGAEGRQEYELTAKGRRLWPTIWSLIDWGNENCLAQANRRSYRHADCGGAIGSNRVCAECGQLPEVTDLVVHPARRPLDRGTHPDLVSETLRRPHRLLEPI